MIKAFAEVLKKNTRVSDLCGHLGGGQFILVLTHIEEDNVQLLIDRLRGQMEARHYTVDGAAKPLVATFGTVASRKSAPLDFVDLLRAADAALVEAKRAKRTSPARELLGK